MTTSLSLNTKLILYIYSILSKATKLFAPYRFEAAFAGLCLMPPTMLLTELPTELPTLIADLEELDCPTLNELGFGDLKEKLEELELQPLLLVVGNVLYITLWALFVAVIEDMLDNWDSFVISAAYTVNIKLNIVIDDYLPFSFLQHIPFQFLETFTFVFLLTNLFLQDETFLG